MKDGKCTSLGDHEFMMVETDTGLSSHCITCGISSYEAVKEHEGTWPISANSKGTPQDADLARNQQLDQLKANAKAHKKHIDRLSAKISQLTQQRDDTAAQLMVKEREAAFFRVEFERHYVVKKVKVGGCEGYVMSDAEPKKSDRTKWSTLLLGAGFVFLSGFLLTLGFFSAVGWVGFIGGLLR